MHIVTQGRLMLVSPPTPYALANEPQPVEFPDSKNVTLVDSAGALHTLPSTHATLAIGRRVGGRHTLRVLTVAKRCVMKCEGVADVSVAAGVWYVSEGAA